jgi:CheY-like chemotaxis protein
MDPAQPLYTCLQEIRKAADRSADLTRQLLAFARKQTVAPKVLELNDTVEGMLKMLRRLIGEDIDLVWRPDSDLWPVKMDPSQIDQILANLCLNARDAIADVGKVTIETHTVTIDETYCAVHSGAVPGDFVMLAVSDDGHGMDKGILDKIFEPFFTTKEAGKGTGLGLATVYGIVKQNDGFIYAYSEPGHGSTFKIYLPRHTAKPKPRQKINPAVPDPQGHETILLVEDEIALLETTKLILEKLGYRVLPASTPDKALSLAGEHDREIHLLITDMVMPGMNGRDLAKKLVSSYPEIRSLFMSGYTSNVIAHHGVLDDGIHFIQKPFSKHALASKVREVLGS